MCERKKKLGTLSFVSKNPLDLRASVAVKGAKATVPKLMRVLEESWHLRDAEGGLATPEFDTGIQFKMCKQILEKFIYVKDLGDLGVIEVAVEKMRCKLMAAKEWNHTCEVTFTLSQQGKENSFCPSVAVDTLLTLLFYQIEPLKNRASLILPSSIARNSSAPNTKRIFEIL